MISTLSVPLELTVFTYLQPRFNLSSIEKQNYRNLHKGHEGEQKLLNLLDKHLSPNYSVLSDLLLEVTDTEFQIDILLIGQNKVYPLEVKNYEGDFYIHKDSWYTASTRNEIRNPLHQLKRCELLLQRFLQQTDFSFSVEPYIIFINLEFQLYEAALDLPIIFPTQVNRFIRKLNSISVTQTEYHNKLIKQCNDHRLSQSSNKRLPKYDFIQLKKGIICQTCSHFLIASTYEILICRRCGIRENVNYAVKRNIKEFITLFPDKKITTSIIHEWCDIINSKKTIRRILKKYLKPIGKGRNTYYVLRK